MLLEGSEQRNRAEDEDETDEHDHQPREPCVRATLRERLVGASLPPSNGSAHEAGTQVRRNRNGVVSASRLETLRSCFRVLRRSLP